MLLPLSTRNKVPVDSPFPLTMFHQEWHYNL